MVHKDAFRRRCNIFLLLVHLDEGVQTSLNLLNWMKGLMTFRCKRRKVTNEEILNLLLLIRKEYMTAIDDLNTSIDALVAAVNAEVAALADAVARAGVDDSADIEAAVARVQSATATLTASLQPAPAPEQPVEETPAEDTPAQ
jgi:hypothetical protein